MHSGSLIISYLHRAVEGRVDDSQNRLEQRQRRLGVSAVRRADNVRLVGASGSCGLFQDGSDLFEERGELRGYRLV